MLHINAQTYLFNTGEAKRVISCPVEQNQILNAYHYGTNLKRSDGSHWSRDKLAPAVRELCYFPHIWERAGEISRHCLACQRNKINQVEKGFEELHPVPVPRKVWKQIGIDLMGPYTEVSGMRYVCTVVCYTSKMMFVKALPSKHGYYVAEFVWYLMSLFGSVQICISDQGGEFNNEFVNGLFDLSGTNHRVTRAYHPQANGLVENQNKKTLSRLRRMIDKTKNWLVHLNDICFNCNNFRHASTKFTPSQVFLGWQPTSYFQMQKRREWGQEVPLSPGGRDVEESEEDLEEYVQQIEKAHQLVWGEAVNNIHKAQAVQKAAYDKKKGTVTFKPGDKVMRINMKEVTRKEKLVSAGMGPYLILRIAPGGRGAVLQDLTKKTKDGVHPVLKAPAPIGQLYPFNEPNVDDKGQPLPGGNPFDPPSRVTDEELTKILDESAVAISAALKEPVEPTEEESLEQLISSHDQAGNVSQTPLKSPNLKKARLSQSRRKSRQPRRAVRALNMDTVSAGTDVSAEAEAVPAANDVSADQVPAANEVSAEQVPAANDVSAEQVSAANDVQAANQVVQAGCPKKGRKTGNGSRKRKMVPLVIPSQDSQSSEMSQQSSQQSEVYGFQFVSGNSVPADGSDVCVVQPDPIEVSGHEPPALDHADRTKIFGVGDDDYLEVVGGKKGIAQYFRPWLKRQRMNLAFLTGLKLKQADVADLPFIGVGKILKGRPVILKNVAGDGHCLFRALSHLIFGRENMYWRVRVAICNWIKDHWDKVSCYTMMPKEKEEQKYNPDGSVDTNTGPYLSATHYINRTRMCLDGWGTCCEMFTFAFMTGCDLVVFFEGRWHRYCASGDPTVRTKNAGYLYLAASHFQAVMGV